MSLAENLVVTRSNAVNYWSLVSLVLVICPRLVRDERPQLVEVDRRAPVLLLRQMEVTHADFTEVTRMIFVEIDAMVMLAASVTTTTGMLSVLANTAMAATNMPSQLSTLLVLCRHRSEINSISWREPATFDTTRRTSTNCRLQHILLLI